MNYREFRVWVVAACLVACLSVVTATSIHAAEAQFELVSDINPGTEQRDLLSIYDNGGSTIMNGKTLFRGCDGVHGCELWSSDGTALGTHLLVDLAPGPAHGMALRSDFPALDGLAYFVVSNAAGIYQLWRTDGTEAGTELFVERIGWQSEVTAYGGYLWFKGWDSTHGDEPWVSDGTEAGTMLLADLESGTGDSDPELFTGAGSQVYFSAFTTATGIELFATDGTSAGTYQVADIEPGPVGSSPNNLIAFGSLLLASATEGSTGAEIWRTDGTGPGTFRIDIAPGVDGSFPVFWGEVNGVMLLSATDGTTGWELWRTNGTIAEQIVNLDGDAGSGVSLPGIRHGNFIYFAGDDGATGVELWRSDGTLAGTTLVADIASGSLPSRPRSFVQVGAWLYFSADDYTYGRELWATNGDGTITQMVIDLDGTSASSLDDVTTGFPGPGGTLLIAGDVEPYGYELWRTDGTTGGTLRLTDVTEPLSSNPRYLTPWQGGLALRPATGPSGQLVTTDGTPAGTTVHDFMPENPYSGQMVEWQGSLFLSDWNYEESFTRLWTWNGSSETLIAEEATGGSFNLYRANAGVVLNKGSRLHLTDGTAVGDFAPLELASSPAISYRGLWVEGNTVHSSDTTDGSYWKTNLADDTSELVADPTQPDETWWSSLGVSGGIFYFTIDSDYYTEPVESYVWASDGTNAGSGPVLTTPWRSRVVLGEVSGLTYLIIPTADRSQWELYSTNGTAAGTSLVATGAGYPESAVYRDGWMVFDTSESLWLSDGTTGGTTLVPDTIGWVVHQALNGYALISGLQQGRGWEFALLDPSDGAMIKLPEIEAGPAGTSVSTVKVSDHRLWTGAFRSDTGNELFVLDLTEWLSPAEPPLFADDFETNDFSAWSSTVP